MPRRCKAGRAAASCGPSRGAELERLLRYCTRPTFTAERLEALDAHRLIYHLPRPGSDERTQLILSPLELIELIAALVPPPRQRHHRYYSVLALDAPLQAAVTALAPEAVPAQPSAPAETSSEAATEKSLRSPASYLRAMLLACIYEVFPLTCPVCGAKMRIIAFVAETAPVQRILDHMGEAATPPRITPARGPPSWDDHCEAIVDDDGGFTGDPLVQPEPALEFDQRVSWQAVLWQRQGFLLPYSASNRFSGAKIRVPTAPPPGLFLRTPNPIINHIPQAVDHRLATADTSM